MNRVLPGMPSENHPLQQPWHRLSNTVSICQFAEAGTESKPPGVNNYFKKKRLHRNKA